MLFSASVKRIRRLLLPATLLVLYATAIGIGNLGAVKIFSRIGLATAHMLAGFLLILMGCILLYDCISRRCFASSDQFKGKRKNISIESILGSVPRRRLINALFYGLLTIMGILGVVLRFPDGRKLLLLESELSVRILHSRLGWFLISVVILKYYITVMDWFRRLMDYLKTH